MDRRFFQIIFQRQNFTDDDIDALIEMLESRRSCNRATQAVLDQARMFGWDSDQAWEELSSNNELVLAVFNNLEVDFEYIEENLQK